MRKSLKAIVLPLLAWSIVSQPATAYEPDVTQERDEIVPGAPDHLIPSGGEIPEEQPRYYIAKFGRYPSFDQAFEWQLVSKDGRYVLTSWRLKRNSDRETTRRVETREVEVQQALAAVLYEIWANGILHSRYARNGPGLDGTSYSFTTYLKGVGWPGAWTWSPEEGPPKVLVDAGEEILTFGRTRTGNAEQLLIRLRAKNEYLNDYYARRATKVTKAQLESTPFQSECVAIPARYKTAGPFTPPQLEEESLRNWDKRKSELEGSVRRVPFGEAYTDWNELVNQMRKGDKLLKYEEGCCTGILLVRGRCIVDHFQISEP